MAITNTGSLISDENGNNRTGTAVSTNIIIKVGNIAVGAVTNMQVTEDRNIALIDEVGTDGHIDSVPQKSTDISGSCERTRFDGLRIAAAFSRSFIHVKSQRIPFDIQIIDTFFSSDPSTNLVTTIKNVWIRKIGYSYRADNFVIVDNMDWVAEDIYSTVSGNNGNAVRNIAGARNDVFDAISGSINPFEAQADRGDRRGALDAAGLLVAISENF